MKRARYQNGSVVLDRRRNIWYFRWSEGSTRRAARLGTLIELPKKPIAAGRPPPCGCPPRPFSCAKLAKQMRTDSPIIFFTFVHSSVSVLHARGQRTGSPEGGRIPRSEERRGGK